MILIPAGLLRVGFEKDRSKRCCTRIQAQVPSFLQARDTKISPHGGFRDSPYRALDALALTWPGRPDIGHF
jgi:hypothetical protein